MLQETGFLKSKFIRKASKYAVVTISFVLLALVTTSRAFGKTHKKGDVVTRNVSHGVKKHGIILKKVFKNNRYYYHVFFPDEGVTEMSEFYLKREPDE